MKRFTLAWFGIWALMMSAMLTHGVKGVGGFRWFGLQHMFTYPYLEARSDNYPVNFAACFAVALFVFGIWALVRCWQSVGRPKGGSRGAEGRPKE